MEVYVLLLICGGLSGFLAGMLGIGGGFVVVPVLLFVLPMLGIDRAMIPTVAVATSLAAMVPTSISAVLAQHRRKTLRVEWVRMLAPGVALGSAMGAKVAANVNGAWITTIFAAYASFFALKMMRQSALAAAPIGVRGVRSPIVDALPQWSIGMFIGSFSALAGVGGASLIVPYLLYRDAEMRQASAASSAVGLVISLVGTAGFSMAPTTTAAAHSGLIGYICWPAALAIGLSAIVAAPFGVSIAHIVPVSRLKQAFALVLLVVAAIALVKVMS